jgi:predicted phosphodiesterase
MGVAESDDTIHHRAGPLESDPSGLRPAHLTGAGRRPPLELTTVTSTGATFHQGTSVSRVVDLVPGTHHTHRGISFATLPLPPGERRCRFASVNDVHFGEVEAGRLDDSDRGPVQRVPAGSSPYPEVMNAAVVDELRGSEVYRGPLAAVFVKGDVSSSGTTEEFAAFERCYRPPFGDRLTVVRGNHDAYQGQHEYAGESWVDLPGVSVALMDTTVPGHSGGALGREQIDWLDAMVAAADGPVVVMGHHPPYFGAVDDNPDFVLTPAASLELEELFGRRTAVVAYTAGHTHRHRVQRPASGVPCIEVGCVKDFPGTWAEYEVYDGGILQVVHRLSSPAALAWSEQCRGLYADFGVDYASYALGGLDDRCLPIAWRT